MQEEIFGLKLKRGWAPLSIFPCRWWISLLFLLAFGFQALAQNYQCKKVPVGIPGDLGAIPVDPASIRISTGVHFEFTPENNRILIPGEQPDSVEVCYRRVSVEYLDTLYGRSILTYAEVYSDEPPPKKVNIEEQEIFKFSDVESFGAITRGVSFGNRQNLFVNSALNLQMDGKLSDDLSISAVITDQNIPYQPEGNTQQLRDFDNVFIKLYNQNFDITAGDIVLQNPIEESYFLSYYKNVQGLSANYRYKTGSGWSATSSLSGSAAKGQFASTQINPIENVQGPYKLRGPNGERFIIILANSEKVYIDGKLLERGFDRDYIIDYNLAEVTFSSNIVITRFTRIRIDYEYAEQFYSRSNVTANQTFKKDNLKLYLNYYRESDNPNSTLGFSLSEDDFTQLRNTTNGQGLISGVDSVGYLEGQLLYSRQDTVDSDGNQQTIYVYSSDPDNAFWNVSFTEVGQGQGDYILANRNANGRVYRWVSPLGGVRQGSYAAVINIPTPNRKEMVVTGVSVGLGEHEQVFQEFAISNRDQNLYADLNSENVGYAWKGGITSKRPVGFLDDYVFTGKLTYEYDHENFNAVDRFRSIEYDRNWSYDVFSDTVNRSDQILEAELGIAKNRKNTFLYQLTKRKRSGIVDGYQQQLTISKSLGFFQVQSENFLMDNLTNGRQAQWKRSNNDLSFDLWRLNPGYNFTIDHHSFARGDSAISTLMHYHAHNFYIQSGDSSKAKVRLDYVRRYDQLPQQGEFSSYTAAEELRMSLASQFSPNQRISGQLNYRSVMDHSVDEEDRNIMGRLEWISGYFQNNIKQHVTFSTANTRELKRDFIYVLVPTGEGTHTWRDENLDGIKDLNEFYEAINVDEKNYIKLFTPTDEYIQAFQTTYLHTLDATFPSGWKDRGVALSQMSKLSFNGSIRLNFKSTSANAADRINPFGLDLNDEQYIYARNNNRFTLFYNRNAPGLGFDVSRQNLDNKSLLSGGYELREKDLWNANIRMTLANTYILRLNGGIGELSNQADYVSGRDFQLTLKTYSPELVVQPGKQFRVTGKWERRLRNDQLEESGDFSDINDFSLMLTWLRQGKGSLNANFQWVDIDFQGEVNSFLGYELLEALQPGSNQKWTINWQQSLGRGLQLNLQYFGRKSTENRAVHTGTAQLTAYF
ncbi:MAG: hypothetical protein RLO17_16125 [Cyclobacteriaceae bacterium]